MNEELSSALLRTLPFLIVIVVLAIMIRRGRLKSEAIDLKKPEHWGTYFLWTVGFLAYVLGVELLLNAGGLLEVGPWSHTGIPSIILVVGVVVLAPIAEELLFRGLILNVLNKRIGNVSRIPWPPTSASCKVRLTLCCSGMHGCTRGRSLRRSPCTSPGMQLRMQSGSFCDPELARC